MIDKVYHFRIMSDDDERHGDFHLCSIIFLYKILKTVLESNHQNILFSDRKNQCAG